MKRDGYVKEANRILRFARKDLGEAKRKKVISEGFPAPLALNTAGKSYPRMTIPRQANPMGAHFRLRTQEKKTRKTYICATFVEKVKSVGIL